jgi:tetratricopeptide (TPR) repeat protein
MWQDVLEKSPNKARVRYNVGFLYFKKVMPEKALPYLVRALEIDSREEKYWITLNSAISILGEYEGRCSAGKEYHTTYDKVDPAFKKPWLALSYNNLGLAHEHLGNIYLARENYQKAVTVNPSLDLAWYNLTLVSARQNDTPNVATSLKILRTINPQLEQDAVKKIQEQQRSVKFIAQ